MPMVTSSARPSFTLPTRRPKATTDATGMTSNVQTAGSVVQALGFSNGWAELALKKPPPLVPSSLMASWLAIGPIAMTCLAPSRVVASIEPSKVCGTPDASITSAMTIDRGNSR